MSKLTRIKLAGAFQALAAALFPSSVHALDAHLGLQQGPETQFSPDALAELDSEPLEVVELDLDALPWVQAHHDYQLVATACQDAEWRKAQAWVATNLSPSRGRVDARAQTALEAQAQVVLNQSLSVEMHNEHAFLLTLDDLDDGEWVPDDMAFFSIPQAI